MASKGRPISLEMKHSVVQVKTTLDHFKSQNHSLEQPSVVLTAQLLNIGEASVRRIMAEYNKHGQTFPPQNLPSPLRTGPAYSLSANLAPIVRRFISQANVRGEAITVADIKKYLEEKIGEKTICLRTLERALHRWGFEWLKINNTAWLKECQHIVTARRRFIRRLKTNQQAACSRAEIYLDESYLHQNHSTKMAWQWGEEEHVKRPAGKGSRWVLVDAISSEGWVEGASLIYDPQKEGEFQGQMDKQNFQKWFKTRLLENIPDSSLIILDNAPYHNALEPGYPRKSDKKDVLKRYVLELGYSVEGLLKNELWSICERYYPKAEIEIDKMVRAYGHEIVRLPPYHPELQPIELAWAQLKNYVMKENNKFSMKGSRLLLERAGREIKKEECEKMIKKSRKEMEVFWERDALIEKFYE